MNRRLGVVTATLALVVVLAATPAGGAAAGLGETAVSPTTVSTGETETLDLSVNATAVNTTDGTTGANVTVTVPAALDLSGATVTAEGVTPNATGASASVDDAANAVVVSWDDDGGADSETVAVTVTVSGVAVDRTGEHDLSATVDADGDGTTDATGAVGTVTVSTAGRSVTTPGTVVYLGEEDVDLTGLDGAAAAGERQRFFGNGGEADGKAATVDDNLAAEVTRDNSFVPGTYALSLGSGASTVVVERPSVTDVELSPGETAGGADVAGSSVPTSVETLTVDAQFDFAAAENATVVVEDANGLTVTDELTADPTVTSPGEPVRLDVSDLRVGTYTVRVEGTDDLDHVNETATVRIRDEARTVSVSRTRVARGESTVATVSGAPGAVWQVQVPADALRDGESVSVPTAKGVFGAADGLVVVGADDEADVLYAVVGLDDDGFAKVELDTERLDRGTHDVGVARNLTAPEAESVPVTVTDRRVSVTPARTNLSVGETVTVSGTTRGADDVKLYARVGGEYAPLYADDDEAELAETSVETDGSWEVDLDTRSVVNVAGRYHVVAVANPGDDYLGSTDRIDDATLRDFDAVGRSRIETTDPSPSASVSPPRIATTDEVTITGRAPGPGETVRVYVVSPRGDVDPLDVAASDDGTFEFDYADFETVGTYRVLLVTPGRDATFGFDDGGSAASIRSELTGSETAAGAVTKIRDAHGGVGVDDRILDRTVAAAEPRVAVETVRHRDDELVVAGTANRENGTTVLVDLRRETRAVAVADAAVNASGRWRATVDVSGVDAGEYDLRVAAGETTDVRTVRLGAAATATETRADAAEASTATASPTPPSETASPTPLSETAAAVAADETRNATARAARTETTGDGFGFGAVAALVALLVVLARRRP